MDESEILRRLELLRVEHRDLDVAIEALRTTPLFVSHQRIANVARELGIEEVVVAGSGDEALATAIVRYYAAPVE